VRRAAIAFWILLSALPATAEEACPKYRDGCVPLDQFKCDEVSRSRFIFRVCYAAPKRYMIVWLGKNRTPYHYCSIDAETVAAFLAADSMGTYYNTHIRGTRAGRGPFDCRDNPVPAF